MMRCRWTSLLALLFFGLGACAEAEGEASAERAFDDALAALEARDPVACEIAAEKAAALGGAAHQELRDFLLGNAAWTRAEAAEALVARPEAGVTAFDAAIAHFAQAGTWWRRAAARRPDWPAARRNVERAERRLEGLRRRRTEALERNRKKAASPERERPRMAPEEQPGEVERPEGKPITEESEVQPLLGELAAEQIRSLFDRLDAKEREKLRTRRDRQRGRGATAEKDW